MGKKIEVACKFCATVFSYYPSKQSGFYCSKSCGTKDRWKSGNFTARSGKANGMWKDDAGYMAVHQWIRRQKGKPSLCEFCGSTDAKKFEWASKSHSYKRDLDDWIRLCVSCHRRYDMTSEYRKNLSINGKKGAIARWGN